MHTTLLQGFAITDNAHSLHLRKTYERYDGKEDMSMSNPFEKMNLIKLGKDLGIAAMGMMFLSTLVNKVTEQDRLDASVTRYLDARYPRESETEES